MSGLVKTFGRTRALDGLDLAVRTGEVHGFLGPNVRQVRPGEHHPPRAHGRDRHAVRAAAPDPHLDRRRAGGGPNGIADHQGVHDLKIDGTHVRFDVDTKELDSVLKTATAASRRAVPSSSSNSAGAASRTVEVLVAFPSSIAEMAVSRLCGGIGAGERVYEDGGHGGRPTGSRP